MPCGAALYFDRETEIAIRRVWQVIDDAGYPSKMLGMNYAPHLTMMVCEDSNVDALRQVLPEFLSHFGPIPVSFHSLGVFASQDGVIYLAPTVNQTLLDFHRQLWNQMEPYLYQYNSLYGPSKWVPHVTLNLDIPLELVGPVVELLLRTELPRNGLITEFQYSELTPDQPVELIKVHLGEKA